MRHHAIYNELNPVHTDSRHRFQRPLINRFQCLIRELRDQTYREHSQRQDSGDWAQTKYGYK
ncbi:hypothetical protein D3C74_436500 [compost metagenome]